MQRRLAETIGGNGAGRGAVEESSSKSARPKVIFQKALSLASFNDKGKAGGARGARPKDVIPLNDGDFKSF